MLVFKIVELDKDGRYPIRLLGLVKAYTNKGAREKASDVFKNKEIVSTGFYEAILISTADIQKRKKELLNEFRKYENIK